LNPLTLAFLLSLQGERDSIIAPAALSYYLTTILIYALRQILCMGLRIKDVQYGQLVSVISFATCDNDCINCAWKNNDNYNSAEFDCLLKELRSILPDDKPKKDDDEATDRVLNYLKRKEE
jgi:hypothetical protein